MGVKSWPSHRLGCSYLAAINLLVVVAALVVVVGLEGQLGAALHAAETAGVEEGVVLEGPDLVGGVDRLAAPQAVAVHVVRLEHRGAGGGHGSLATSH